MRSFSNLWYWIVLAVMWSSLSHWVLGIPYHMVQRARRGHADSQRDLLVLVEVNTRRIKEFGAISGVFFVGGGWFCDQFAFGLGLGLWGRVCPSHRLAFVAAFGGDGAERLDRASGAERRD